MKNDGSRYSERLLGVHPAVALSVMLLVASLSMGDIMEVIPLFAGAVASAAFPFFHEVHDILAMGLGLFAAYKYSTRLGIAAILLFLAAHFPYATAEFPEEAPELFRILVTVFVALFGIGLVSRLHKEERKVRREAEEWRATFDAVSDPLSVHDTDFKIVKANKAYAQLLKMNPEDIIGKNCYQLVHGADEPCLTCPFVTVIATKESATEEFFEPRLGVYIQITASPTTDDRGDITGCVHVIKDVTERKRVEERLLYLASFPELNPFLIIEIDMHGGVNYLNPTSKEYFPSLAETGSQHPILSGILQTMLSGQAKESSFIREVKVDEHYYQQVIHKVKAATEGGESLRIYGYDITARKQAEESLRRSEENFRRSNDESPLGIRIVTTEGETVYANHTILNIYGFKNIEELRTTPTQQRYTPESYAEHLARKEKRQKGHYVPSIYEVSIVRGDSEIRHLQAFRKEVLWDGKKQFQVMYQDITERKKAEEDLLQSKERFRRLSEASFEGIVISEDGIVLDANETMATILKCSLSEMIGTNVLEFIAPESQSLVRQNVASGYEQPYEMTCVRKDGSTFQAEAHGKMVVRNGHMVRITAVRDITERKRMEEDLTLKALLLDSAGDSISVLDSRRRLRYVNKTFCEAHGYSKDDLLGMSMYQLDPQEHDRGIGDISKVLGRGDEVIFEAIHKRKDGSTFNVEVRALRVYSNNEQLLLSVERDITERKKMQEQLMAQDRLASIGQLVSGVAHEINNPLTGVIGFSDLLISRNDLPDDAKADLKVVNDEAKRTAVIVKNLLTFARKQAEGKSSFDINEQIQRVIDLRAHEQKVNNIDVAIRFGSDLPKITGNSSQLQQVFFNIVINAEFFMLEAHKKGKLTITTEQIGDFVRASFADDGPGISEEHMKSIFNPFFTTKDVGKGTGLGLSICHGIITEHSGKIYAESSLGKGATFIVELPFMNEAARQEATT